MNDLKKYIDIIEESDSEPVGRVKMVCSNCGSDDVVKKAWVDWNPDTQGWEVEEFGTGHCRNCDAVDSILSKPLT